LFQFLQHPIDCIAPAAAALGVPPAFIPPNPTVADVLLFFSPTAMVEHKESQSAHGRQQSQGQSVERGNGDRPKPDRPDLRYASVTFLQFSATGSGGHAGIRILATAELTGVALD
jgi:hypothetical protein